MNDAILSLYNGSVLSIAILIFLLGVVAVKSARSAWARLAIISFTLCSYTALFVGPIQLLSYAKPVSMEWVNKNVEEAEVLHAELREGDGIYLLLDWYGVPRYYKMPWDPILAQQLIEAMEQARQEAGDGDRAGARTPQDAGEQGQGQEQGMLDQLLGPMNDSDESGEMGELSEGEKGQGQGQGQSGMPGAMGAMGMSQGQGQQSGRGEQQNAGNGRVMMRRPFSDGEGEFESDGEGDGDGEGEGPSGGYNDVDSPAMFYPAPQPRYPEKVVPEG